MLDHMKSVVCTAATCFSGYSIPYGPCCQLEVLLHKALRKMLDATWMLCQVWAVQSGKIIPDLPVVLDEEGQPVNGTFIYGCQKKQRYNW